MWTRPSTDCKKLQMTIRDAEDRTMKCTTISVLAVISCLVASGNAWGHEGHPTLPSKGAKVDGETLMITSAGSRESNRC